MATTTTTTGGSYAPNPPAWAIDPLKQGIAGALTAAQQNPYAGLNRGNADFSQNQWNQATSMLGVAGYQPGQITPLQVGAPMTTAQQVGAPIISAGQVNQFAGGTGSGGLGLGGMDLSGYMNPYTSSVIDQTARDLARQTTIQQQQQNGQAARAGAFGGDRAAIVNAETQRNSNDTLARTAAALNAQNFTQAQGQANTDVTRQLQAGTAQVGAGLTAEQANQAAWIRAGQGNQAAQLQADQGNQAAWIRAGQGNQSAQLQADQINQSNGLQAQNLRLNALGQTAGLLSQEQASRQRGLDYQYQDDTNRALWDVNGNNNLLNATSRLPWSQITPYETTGNNTAPGPSTTGQIIGGLTSGVGLLGALGGQNGVSGGLSTIGNGISSAYNGAKGLFGIGSGLVDASGGFGASDLGQFANTGVDWANGFADGAGGIGSAADGVGSIFDGAGWSFARGGVVHDVDDMNDPTFAPLTAPQGIAAYAGGGQVQGFGVLMSPEDKATDAARWGDQSALEAERLYDQGMLRDVNYRAGRDKMLAAAQADAMATMTQRNPDQPDAPPLSFDEATGQAAAFASRANGLSPSQASEFSDTLRRTMAPPSAEPAAAAPQTSVGLSAAIDPLAPPLAVPDGPPEEPGLPVPPIPPDVVPPVPEASRAVARAVPAAAPAAAPTGIAAAVAQPVSYTPPAASGQGIAGLQAAAQSAAPAATAAPATGTESANPLWSALIKAGGAMMASRSTTGLGAVGEGLIAGVDSVTRDKEKQLAYAANKAQLDALERHRLAMEGKTERDLALKNTFTLGGAAPAASGTGGTRSTGSTSGASFLQTDAGGPSREFAGKMIGVESGGRADAKNPLSSATGAGQFIDGTWLSMVRKHAPELAEGKSDSEVLALRNNGDLSRAMVVRYAQDNAADLQKAGVPANDTTLALAHRFGPSKAADVLKAAPDTPITELVSPQVMRQNPDLRGKTVGQVQQFYAGRFGVGERAGTQLAQNGQTATDASPAAAQPTFYRNPYTGEFDTRHAPAGLARAVLPDGREGYAKLPGTEDVGRNIQTAQLRDPDGKVGLYQLKPDGTRGARIGDAATQDSQRAPHTVSTAEGVFVQNADGSLGARLGGLPREAEKPVQMPGADVRKAVTNNMTSLRNLDNALAAVQANPDAFGGQNYLPDGIVQRMDENGVGTRAQVANIGSLIIHERAGAAQSAGEMVRLKPFIPAATDSPAVVKTKLEGMRQRVREMLQDQYDIYGPSNGFKPIPGHAALLGVEGEQPATSAAPRVGTIQDGYRFKGGNPADPGSWTAVR